MANIRAKHNDTLPTVANEQWSDLQVDSSGRLLVSDGPSNDPGTIEALDGASATGSGVVWPGGDGALFVSGTWDGAIAALEWSPDNVTWYALGSGSTLTADGGLLFSLPSGYVRVAITNAGTTSLDAIVRVV